MSKLKSAPKIRPEGKLSAQDKLTLIFEAMDASLIERTEEIRILIISLICQEHPLFVGPPGTAKSLLLDSLLRALGGKAFSILFNKFTTPEEVFGPISVSGLKQDQYRRITTDMLPEADWALGDEVFKASSAILNTLLRIVNERVFSSGGKFINCPLKLFVGASNEWPGEDGKELGALFDRFLFRKKVEPIKDVANRRRLLFGARDHSPKFNVTMSPQELNQAMLEARDLDWTKDAEDTMIKIIEMCHQDGIWPGDRRQFKSVRAVQANAYLKGADEVRVEDLDILMHTLWDDPNEQPEKVERIVWRMSDAVGYEVKKHQTMMEDVLNKVMEPKELVAKLMDIVELVKPLPNHPKKNLLIQCLESNIKTAHYRVMGVQQ